MTCLERRSPVPTLRASAALSRPRLAPPHQKTPLKNPGSSKCYSNGSKGLLDLCLLDRAPSLLNLMCSSDMEHYYVFVGRRRSREETVQWSHVSHCSAILCIAETHVLENCLLFTNELRTNTIIVIRQYLAVKATIPPSACGFALPFAFRGLPRLHDYPAR